MEIIEKLREIKEKYDHINEQLTDPTVATNQEKIIKLSKERSQLQEVVEAYNKYAEVLHNIEGNLEVIKASDDPELKEMAEAELNELKENKIILEEEIKVLLIPKDPNDDKNVIVEIRAGTGGDEAGIFFFFFLRMYTRFAERMGWEQELIDYSESGMD